MRLVIPALALIALLPTVVQAAPITLTNATTSLQVNGGEADNGLVPFDGYFRYTDLAAAEETTWSIDPLLRFSDGSTLVLSDSTAGGFGSPVDAGSGMVASQVLGAGSGLVDVVAITELVGSNARTTFTFTAASALPLDGLRFVFYAENDLFIADDTASFTGSIGGGDLVLYMYDTANGGLTVRMTSEQGAGATLDLFGADEWTAFGNSLEGGDLSVLSADGSNFAAAGDLGLVFAYSLSGTKATVVINYDTQPVPPTGVPAPSSLGMIGLGLALVGLKRAHAAA